MIAYSTMLYGKVSAEFVAVLDSFWFVGGDEYDSIGAVGP